VEEFDDVGLAPSIGIIGIAGGDDVLRVYLGEDDVAVFRLQIRPHVGIQKPAADKRPATRRPLGVDLATEARGNVGTFVPRPFLELGYTHDGAAFAA